MFSENRSNKYLCYWPVNSTFFKYWVLLHYQKNLFTLSRGFGLLHWQGRPSDTKFTAWLYEGKWGQLRSSRSVQCAVYIASRMLNLETITALHLHTLTWVSVNMKRFLCCNSFFSRPTTRDEVFRGYLIGHPLILILAWGFWVELKLRLMLDADLKIWSSFI